MEKVKIPEGISGPWSINHFEITEEQARFENMRMSFKGFGGRYVIPGKYTSLVRSGCIIMSDTPAEMRDHREFVRQAKGNVLINGLGIGMCLQAVLDKPEVLCVTVVEKSKDVIALVGDHYNDKRLTIYNDCAFTFKPSLGIRYNTVWHDIWDNITSENLPEMTKLHRKYGKRTDWQGSWCQHECKRIKGW